MIKAIQTEYAGYLFRSRLEARWAVFFNAMGVKWYYEHEGYELSSGWYLPDFWIPGWGLHIEVKPPGVWCQHAEAFLNEVGAIVVTQGLPEEEHRVYCFDTTDSTGGCGDFDVFFRDDEQGCLALHTGLHRERTYYTTQWESTHFIRNGDGKKSFRLRDAFNLAKQARFDKRK